MCKLVNLKLIAVMFYKVTFNDSGNLLENDLLNEKQINAVHRRIAQKTVA